MDLDQFDRKLLNLVQEDAARTAESMADQVALSVSAIQRRLRRMREVGVIERDVALVDPGRVDPSTAFVVSIHIERESSAQLAQFRVWLTEQKQVQQAFYVTGEADFLLVVTAPSAEGYEAFMLRMINENPIVKRIITNVVMSTIKRGLTIPV
jgi:Lrp/AsnC family leucine-responsive transcriptional regulator